MNRTAASTKENLEGSYDLRKTAADKRYLADKPERWWNLDEAGLLVEPKLK
jgi:hypothetical protein